MKFSIFSLSLAVFIGSANAQSPSFDITGTGVGGFNNVAYVNFGALDAKTAPPVDYADVNGNPYYDTRWRRALLVLQNGEAIKANKVKLNLYNWEVRYIDSAGAELVATAGAIKNIVFIDSRDTNKISAVFQAMARQSAQGPPRFVQVLNQGAIGLLKLTEVGMAKLEYDALAAKDQYNFQPKVSYFVMNNGIAMPLKVLNKENVFSAVPPLAGTESWLNDNKNKLKKESEVVNYFNYYNGAK